MDLSLQTFQRRMCISKRVHDHFSILGPTAQHRL